MASTLFRQSPSPVPPNDLLIKILTRVHEERTTAWRFKMRALIAISVTSVAALGFALYAAAVSLAQSGTPVFLKLAVTDTGAVLMYWKDFAYSLLETIPAGGLAVALTLGAVVAITLRALARATRTAHQPYAFTL